MQSTSEDPQFHSFIRKWQRIKNQFLISCRIINQCKTFSFFFIYILQQIPVYYMFYQTQKMDNLQLDLKLRLYKILAWKPCRRLRTPPKEDSMCEPFIFNVHQKKRAGKYGCWASKFCQRNWIHTTFIQTNDI